MILLNRCICLILSLFLPGWILAQDFVPEAPSAILVDQLTGRVLYRKQPDLPIPPASLTKLMTLHLTWKAIQSGQVQPSDLVPVTAETTGAAVPPNSSLMFLEPGQQVTVRELMLGLAVDSGNDAGLTLAQFLAGTQEAFVFRMNQEAQNLGLSQTVFFDTFGYSPRNRTTAGDFARFCRLYLQLHPQAVQILHNVPELAYPQELNRAPGDRRPLQTIVQPNRNPLLGVYPGVDGLKTGFIDEAGYHLAATAVRDGQRLVAVILGIPGRSTAEGNRLRIAAGSRLLDFGFDNYPLRPLPLPELSALRVWYAEPGTVVPAPAGPTVYPLGAFEGSAVTVRVEAPVEILGPLAAGTVVGQIIWSWEGRDFHQVDLKSPVSADSAPWWIAFWDAMVLFFRGFTGAPAPLPADHRTES